MKQIFKRFLILMLVLSFSVSGTYVKATSEDIALFQTEALNLFEKEADGTTDWNKPITRAEFAHVMSIVLGQTNQGVGFSLMDVNENTKYRGDIYNMLLLGLMSGDGNSCFRPDDNIKLSEAAVVFLRAMGYSHVISQKKYPDGVVSYAVTLSLLDNVKMSGEFTRRSFAMMLHNSLDVSLMTEAYTTGINREYYITDTKFGDVVFSANGEGSAYYGVGIVMQNAMSFVDVQYKKLEKNEVIIGETLYETGSLDVTGLLGMEVRFLAKERADGKYVLMNISPTEKNEVTYFNSSDFASYEDEISISYYDEDDKKEQIRLNSQTRIIKNFDTIENPSDSIFQMDCGEYTVIDNDSDSIAELIVIYSYENAVVSGAANNVIALKEGFKVNGSRYINLDEENQDILYFVHSSSGKPIDVNSLSGNSVISAATDRTGKIIKIIAKEDAVLTADLSSADDEYIYLYGEGYSVLSTKQYTIGDRYDFYLNFKDDIIYFEEADDSPRTKYGYVIAAGKKSFNRYQIKLLVSKQVDFGVEINDEDEDNVTQIPMLVCKNEEIKILDMADKIRIDNDRIAAEDLPTRTGLYDSFYKFELNADGELRSLETVDFKAGSVNQTFKYNIYDKCFSTGSTAYEGFAINEKTQILCIPSNPTCDEDYMVKNVINKDGNTIGYKVRGFDYDETTKKCRLIVIEREMKHDNLPGVSISSSKVAIVKNLKMVKTEEGDFVPQIEFAIAGEDKKMPFTDVAATIVPFLKIGDLFTYTQDYEDRISNFMIVRSMSELSSDFSGISGLAPGASETFGSLEDIAYDEVYEITNALTMEFYINVGSSSKIINIPQRNTPPIYIYNGKEEIGIGSIEDIVPGTDKVYVFMSSATAVAAVVVLK